MTRKLICCLFFFTILCSGTTLQAQFTSSSFDPRVSFTSGSNPSSVATGDLDGDGKSDVAITNNGSHTVSVMRNISTSGNIILTDKKDSATGYYPAWVAIGDLDGDSKPDLAVVNLQSNTVSVFRNTSAYNNISFEAKKDFLTGSGPNALAIGDLDQDGKADLAITNYYSYTISVLRNTSTTGNISFAAKTDFATGTSPRAAVLKDVDGDGMNDISLVSSGMNAVSVFRNTSTSGIISFAPKTDFSTGAYPTSVALGDIDGDNRPEIVVANYNENTASLFRNTSVSGTISFSAKVNLSTGLNPIAVAVKDLDGDGQADVAVANNNSFTVSVFRNKSTLGSLVFDPKADFSTGSYPQNIATEDIDGDNNPDLTLANNFSTTFSILRNNSKQSLYVSSNTLNNFNQNIGTPSATQTFTVGGSSLTGNIFLTAPANYQISRNGSTWKDTLNLAPVNGTVITTTINVRLNATNAGTYSGNISIASNGVTTENKAVSGITTSQPPTLDVYSWIYSSYSQTVGTPSAAQKIYVRGGYINGNVTITAPVGYELSKDGSTWSNALIRTPVNGSIDDTLSVRLNATSGGAYNGNITTTTTGISPINTPVSGTAIAAPALSVSGTINDFQALAGVPSTAQNITVSGAGLTGNITLTAPANFQISRDNSTWATSLILSPASGSVAATTVYVRFYAAAIGTYNGTITTASSGATTLTTPVKGYAVAFPSVTVTASLTPFTQTIGSPSAVQTFTVSGSSLNGSIILQAPTGFELSNGTAAWNSSLSLSPVNGTVALTAISVRLNATASGTYAGNITTGSNGATTVNTTVTGTATQTQAALMVSTSALSNFTQSTGTPSATQSFTVSGSGLTGNITVTAPANFQLSLDGNTWNSSLTLTAVNGAVSTTGIHVRLNAAAAGTYTGNIATASNGFTTVNTAVSGTATPGTIVSNPVPSSQMWVTNGTVNTVVREGNTVYLGGNFTQVVPATPVSYGAGLNPATGLPDLSFPKVEGGEVLATAPDGKGGWYIGGTFYFVGGQRRAGLARINADGTLDSWNPSQGAFITALAVSGNTVYAGGDFMHLGGQYRNNIAALDATTGLATAWNPDANASVNALFISGSTVYIGGLFTSIGGQARNHIAAVHNTTGLATTWNPNADGQVQSIVVSGSTVYAAGLFTSIGGQNRTGIAALNVSTGLASSWNPNPAGAIYSVVLNGNTVYVCGGFTSIGGQSRNHIAAIDATTGNATPWAPDADDFVQTIAISGNTLYAGGGFHNIGGQARNNIAALDLTTGLATSFNPNANNWVWSITPGSTRIYAGGWYTSIGGQNRNHIAAIDVTTGAPAAWNPGADNPVSSIAVSGSTVYAGGKFNSIGGQNRNYIAALDAATGLATSWNPHANDSVSTLSVNGSTVYAGGYFTQMGGQARNRIAALSTTTGMATSWNPNANSFVTALAVSGSTVYAGGGFTNIAGQNRNHIAALDATTGSAFSWNPNANNKVYSLAVNGSTVYAGGSFTSIGGQARNYLAALDAATAAASAWNPNTNGAVRSLAVNGTVYAGGDFTSAGGQTRNRLAAFDAATGTPALWNPNANNSVLSLTLYDTTAYAGGSFTSISGGNRRSIAAIGIAVAATPALNVSGSFNAFTQTTGTPSAAQTFTVSGSGLTGNITLTAPAGYELSVNGTTWNNSLILVPVNGTLALTTVSIRLNASAPGTYAGNITAASAGVTTVNTPVNGTTVSGPSIGIYNSFTGFTQTAGTPSAAQTIMVYGRDLTGNVTITVPPGYEISRNGTTWSNTFTSSPINGYTADTLSVRLNAATAGTYAGNLTAVSAGVAPVTKALAGTVIPVQPVVSVSSAVLSTFNQNIGAPSAAQTFTAGGTSLTGNITLTAPPGYQLSRDGLTWKDSLQLAPVNGTVPNTAIQVRLHATIAGTYPGNITLASTGAASISKAVYGITVPVTASLYISANLASFTQTAGTPSAPQEFFVSATNITGTVTVSAPANYQLSINNSAWSSTLTIYPVNGTAYASVSIRLHAATAGSYTGNIITSCIGANSVATPVYGATASVVAPSVTVTAALNEFTLIIGEPYAGQTFTVSGSHLSGNLTLTAPVGFQLSSNGGSSWRSTVILAPVNGSVNTVISVRLSAPTAGTYGGMITTAGSGITTINIPVSGTAVAVMPPVVIVNADALTSFSQSLGTPSAAQKFTVAGSNLRDKVTLTAPAGFELSANGGTSWSKTISLAPAGGGIMYTVLVRLHAASAGIYLGNIVTATTGSADVLSEIKGATVGDAGGITAGPNPAGAGTTRITVFYPVTDAVSTLTVYSLSGLKQVSYPLNPGTTFTQIPVQDLRAGTYVIEVKQKDAIKSTLFIKL